MAPDSSLPPSVAQIVIAVFLRPKKTSSLRGLWERVHKGNAFAIIYGMTVPTIFLGIVAYGKLLASNEASETVTAWLVVASLITVVMIPMAFVTWWMGPGTKAAGTELERGGQSGTVALGQISFSDPLENSTTSGGEFQKRATSPLARRPVAG